MVSKFEEVGHLGFTGDDQAVGLDLDTGALFLVVGDVPAGETGLALSVLQKNESDLYKLQKRWHKKNNFYKGVKKLVNGYFGSLTYHFVLILLSFLLFKFCNMNYEILFFINIIIIFKSECKKEFIFPHRSNILYDISHGFYFINFD